MHPKCLCAIANLPFSVIRKKKTCSVRCGNPEGKMLDQVKMVNKYSPLQFKYGESFNEGSNIDRDSLWQGRLGPFDKSKTPSTNMFQGLPPFIKEI